MQAPSSSISLIQKDFLWGFLRDRPRFYSALVEEKGFTVVDYTVDPTSESGMVLYAVKEKKK